MIYCTVLLLRYVYLCALDLANKLLLLLSLRSPFNFDKRAGGVRRETVSIPRRGKYASLLISKRIPEYNARERSLGHPLQVLHSPGNPISDD